LPGWVHALNPFSDPDITVVKGTDYFQNTIRAVEALGGIDKFVPRGSSVGLLISPNWKKPGTYTSPDVALAIIKLCSDAGVKEIVCFKNPELDYWEKSAYASKYNSLIKELKGSQSHVEIPISGGVHLKKAEVVPELQGSDVFINIPISKNHKGTNFTGLLKNMMGCCPFSTNRFFHQGSGKGSGFYDDAEFLSQCIADLNLVRQPDLSIIDSTELILTNGPAGPGEILRPQKVIAGTDPVALDAFAAKLIGNNPDDILMIEMAHQHGIGNKNLDSLIIKELEI